MYEHTYDSAYYPPTKRAVLYANMELRATHMLTRARSNQALFRPASAFDRKNGFFI